MNKYIYAVLSAILMALTITFDELWFIALIGLVPYFYCLIKNKLTSKEAFKYGLVFGTSYYFIVLHWIMSMYPLDRYGLSKWQSIVALITGWILLSLYEGLWLSLIAIVFIKLRGSNVWFNSILLGFLWVFVEWGQQQGSLGFSWAILSISQVKFTPMIQIASVFGALAITFIVVIVNALIGTALVYKNDKKVVKTSVIIASIILICNITFGLYRLGKDMGGEKAKVGIIQGNISSYEKWNSDSLNNHLKTYLDLSYNLVMNEGKVEFIVWPETAIPVTLFKKQYVLDKYIELAKKTESNLIVGAYHEKDGKSYNSVYNISPNGVISEPYSKRQLVPFGEFLPFQKLVLRTMPFLANVNMFENSITSGKEAITLKTSRGKVGSIICFESIFPPLSSDLVRNGAKLLVLVSNDSWFKDSKGVYQHLNQAVLRAVENNRYLVRAANTGISVVIDSKGRILKSIGALEQGYIMSDVVLIEENTLYSTLGDIIILFAFNFIFCLYIRKKVYH